jgi:hypothetical protein
MLIFAQYYEQISTFKEQERIAGRDPYYDGGLVSMFVTVPPANRHNLGFLFITEWLVCSYVVSGVLFQACIT